MRSYLMIKAVALLCLFSFSGAVYAQVFKNELGAMADNDVYISYMQDRYYTQGLMLYFRHALRNPARKSGQLPEKLPLEKKILELGIGQKIYNPYSSNAPDVSTHDRPFTAFLYSNASLGLFYKNESILQFSAELGVMGPHALGRQTQNAFHRLFGMHPVRGWEYQLREEIKINTQVTYDRLLFRGLKNRVDVSGQSAVSLGNTYSGISAGALARIGIANPLYKSASHQSRLSRPENQRPNSDINHRLKPEIFIFLRPQLNYVAYDATIEGPLFRSRKGPVIFPNQRFVYSQQLGLNVAKNRWSAKYVVTLLSKETPEANPSYYASIHLGYCF